MHYWPTFCHMLCPSHFFESWQGIIIILQWRQLLLISNPLFRNWLPNLFLYQRITSHEFGNISNDVQRRQEARSGRLSHRLLSVLSPTAAADGRRWRWQIVGPGQILLLSEPIRRPVHRSHQPRGRHRWQWAGEASFSRSFNMFICRVPQISPTQIFDFIPKMICKNDPRVGKKPEGTSSSLHFLF